MKVLFLYSGRDGQTRKIAEYMASCFGDSIECHVTNICAIDARQLMTFDAVVIGVSVRYGHFQPEFIRFVKAHAEILNVMKSALFTVNMLARNPEKCTPSTNKYTSHLLEVMRWHPQTCHVFAGALRYSQYGWLDRSIIRIIMWMKKGPTDVTKDVEYTDWDQVKAFATQVATFISR